MKKNVLRTAMQKIIARFLPEGVLSFQLHLTSRCNLRCIHCYHSSHDTQDLSFEQWKKILDQCADLLDALNRQPEFVLCGGEPILATNFRNIVEEIHRRWPKAALAVTTNGSIMDDDLADFITKHNIAVQISLDGATQESHDFARGIGSFQKIMDTTTILRQKDIHFRTLTVLSRRTRDEISKLFALAASIGASKCNFRRFIISGRGKNLVSEALDAPLLPTEMRAAFIDILDASKRFGVATNTDGPLWVLIDEQLGCHSGFGFQGIIIDSEGFLKVSGATDHRVADLKSQQLESVFLKHPLFVSLRNGEILQCDKCKFFNDCGGDRSAAYAEFGDFLAADPGCWFAANSYDIDVKLLQNNNVEKRK